jgi:hypothetical protein
MRRLIIASSVAGLCLAAPLAAQAQFVPAPVQDHVSLTLSVEDWVKTDTAEVTLVVEAAAPGGDAGSARGEVMKAAQAVSDASWQAIRFDRQQDQAGLDHWQASLRARLPEARLGGLGERARKASRPGLQVRVEQVEFTPTLAETEAVRSRLRADLYKRATEELASANKSLTDRTYRIAGIDFQETRAGGPLPAPMAAQAKFAASDGGGLDVQQKLRVTARVNLATLVK